MPAETGRPFSTLIAGLMALVIAATACGSDGSEEPQSITNDPFCERALEYQRFEPALGQVADDPIQTEIFVTSWIERLDVLIERGPDELEDDLTTIRASVEVLDAELSSTGYNLLELSFEQLDILNDDVDSETAAADREFRAYVDERCSGPAPAPLDEAELAELLGTTGTPGDAEVDAAVTADLVEDLQTLLGITPEASECVAENIDSDTLDDVLAGVLSESTTDGLLAVLDTCGISAEDLAG